MVAVYASYVLNSHRQKSWFIQYALDNFSSLTSFSIRHRRRLAPLMSFYRWNFAQWVLTSSQCASTLS